MYSEFFGCFEFPILSFFSFFEFLFFLSLSPTIVLSRRKDESLMAKYLPRFRPYLDFSRSMSLKVLSVQTLCDRPAFSIQCSAVERFYSSPVRLSWHQFPLLKVLSWCCGMSPSIGLNVFLAPSIVFFLELPPSAHLRWYKRPPRGLSIISSGEDKSSSSFLLPRAPVSRQCGASFRGLPAPPFMVSPYLLRCFERSLASPSLSCSLVTRPKTSLPETPPLQWATFSRTQHSSF